MMFYLQWSCNTAELHYYSWFGFYSSFGSLYFCDLFSLGCEWVAQTLSFLHLETNTNVRYSSLQLSYFSFNFRSLIYNRGLQICYEELWKSCIQCQVRCKSMYTSQIEEPFSHRQASVIMKGMPFISSLPLWVREGEQACGLLSAKTHLLLQLLDAVRTSLWLYSSSVV